MEKLKLVFRFTMIMFALACAAVLAIVGKIEADDALKWIAGILAGGWGIAEIAGFKGTIDKMKILLPVALALSFAGCSMLQSAGDAAKAVCSVVNKANAEKAIQAAAMTREAACQFAEDKQACMAKSSEITIQGENFIIKVGDTMLKVCPVPEAREPQATLHPARVKYNTAEFLAHAARVS